MYVHVVFEAVAAIYLFVSVCIYDCVDPCTAYNYIHVHTSIPNTTVLCDRDILCMIILLLQ